MRSPSPLLSLTLIVALTGCTTTTTTVEHAKQPPRLEQDSLSLQGEFELKDDAVLGEVKLRGKCYERAVEEFTVVKREEPSKVGNWTLIGLGTLAAAGAGVAATKMGDDPKSCKGDTSEAYNADGSKKDKPICLRAVAAVGGITAVVLLGSGLVGLSGSKSEIRGSPVKAVARDRTERDCASPQTLAAVPLELHVPGLAPIPGKRDDSGHTRFELPAIDAAALAEVSPPLASVTVASVPEALRQVSQPGESIAQVSLQPWLEKQRARAGAARRATFAEADKQVFTGTIRGDDEARSAFSMVCTPSGQEVCFDGVDNDCDGLVDNNCGYAPGALQWTLAWSTGDDLDLHAVGPDGAHVFFGHRQGGSSRLALDVDCRGAFGGGCLAGNVENIFTPRDRKPVEGTYRAWVEVFQALDGPPDRTIDATLGGRLAGKAFRIPLHLVAQRGVRTFFAFAIGDDGDKDAVIDREDACPSEAGPWNDVATDRGCPDRDFDGVADHSDACPDEAGLRSRDAKQNGCARRFGKARLTARGVEIDGTVEFDSGSAVIRAASFGLLHDVAQAMTAGAFRRVLVEGHTDDVGDRTKNLILSRDRARAVVAHLTGREHVAADKLLFAFFGPDRPRADNSTPQGKARNRRVEFKVLDAERVTVTRW